MPRLAVDCLCSNPASRMYVLCVSYQLPPAISISWLYRVALGKPLTEL